MHDFYFYFSLTVFICNLANVRRKREIKVKWRSEQKNWSVCDHRRKMKSYDMCELEWITYFAWDGVRRRAGCMCVCGNWLACQCDGCRMNTVAWRLPDGISSTGFTYMAYTRKTACSACIARSKKRSNVRRSSVYNAVTTIHNAIQLCVSFGFIRFL